MRLASGATLCWATHRAEGLSLKGWDVAEFVVDDVALDVVDCCCC